MSKIMVIEEDSAMRVLICEWLAGEGHEVRSLPRHGASRWNTRRRATQTEPSSWWFSTCRTRARAATTTCVRSRPCMPPGHGAAVIGISAQLARSLGGESDVTRALGASRLLAKPCTREELLGAVAATLAA
jgi:DNA-binding response OmpR family regulator